MPAKDLLRENIDTKGSGNSYNETETPVFDESFDLINVTIENSPALSELVTDLQGPVKKGNEIKTVQVLTLFLVNESMVFVLCKNYRRT